MYYLNSLPMILVLLDCSNILTHTHTQTSGYGMAEEADVTEKGPDWVFLDMEKPSPSNRVKRILKSRSHRRFHEARRLQAASDDSDHSERIPCCMKALQGYSLGYRDSNGQKCQNQIYKQIDQECDIDDKNIYIPQCTIRTECNDDPPLWADEFSKFTPRCKTKDEITNHHCCRDDGALGYYKSYSHPNNDEECLSLPAGQDGDWCPPIYGFCGEGLTCYRCFWFRCNTWWPWYNTYCTPSSGAQYQSRKYWR